MQRMNYYDAQRAMPRSTDIISQQLCCPCNIGTDIKRGSGLCATTVEITECCGLHTVQVQCNVLTHRGRCTEAEPQSWYAEQAQHTCFVAKAEELWLLLQAHKPHQVAFLAHLQDHNNLVTDNYAAKTPEQACRSFNGILITRRQPDSPTCRCGAQHHKLLTSCMPCTHVIAPVLFPQAYTMQWQVKRTAYLQAGHCYRQPNIALALPRTAPP